MQWHNFIFSEGKKHKLLRHFIFWLCWWLYFTMVFLLYLQPIRPDLKINPFYFTPGNLLPLKTLSLVILFASACYPLIYIIFPKLISGKWFKGTIALVLLCSLLFVATHLLYWEVFPVMDNFGGFKTKKLEMNSYWPAINLGLMNFAKVAAAALVIKYVKFWWLKRKESQRLAKEKIDTELLLLKAQIHPEFLLNTLNHLHIHAETASKETSIMLLNLSDLLSYMLYECDQPFVPLEKEVAMMKEYMQLEKMRKKNTPEIEINIKGDLKDKMIAPFLILPFIENSFRKSNADAGHWVNLDITVDERSFNMKMAHGIAIDGTSLTEHTIDLARVQKRLALLYPDKHELKMTIEQEMFIVFLNIDLDGHFHTTNEKHAMEFEFDRQNYQTTVLNYVAEQ